MASVQARVAKEGRDAEERRVRVRDGEVVRVEDQPVGCRLHDADDREEGGEGDGESGEQAQGNADD